MCSRAARAVCAKNARCHMTSFFKVGPEYVSTGHELGRGTFATVYLGYSTSTKVEVALKRFDKAKLGLSSAAMDLLKKEVSATAPRRCVFVVLVAPRGGSHVSHRRNPRSRAERCGITCAL
jgi:predicted Ser/Thr protein kinase